MPRQVEAKFISDHRAFFANIVAGLHGPLASDVKAAVVLLAACKDEEEAFEANGHGLFTKQLLNVWHDGAFAGTYDDFIKAIAEGIPGHVQHPCLGTMGKAADDLRRERPFSINAAVAADGD
jgi:hypothetical protein